LDTTTVERPIAELSLLDSSTTGSPLYAVTVDLSAEMGSYSGPYVRLLDGRARRFEWVRARDTHTGELEEIHLPTTLKTAWRLVRRDDGRGSDILLVACRPDFEATASSHSTRLFRITYTRFAFEQAEWRMQRRSTPGFWENEGDFPVRSSFP
jgi:hypothetical protein